MDLELEAAQRVGTTICNKWKLTRLIGTGGMAAVYVGQNEIGHEAAIKILHLDIARDPDLRARFDQEAHAVNRLRHPGAVEIREKDATEDGAPFLVMELLDGQTLSALAREPGGVPLQDLLRYADELLDVLAAAHAQGIIHRDVKPDNLFVLRDGHLKVLDFGIARVRRDTQNKKPKTRLGATLGTAPYMPPEQIKGQEIDARADLFAVGATMFRLIAKRRIHEAANEAETLVKMATDPAPPLASVTTDAPPDVCLVVDRALMFDRASRYPDALTMQEDVRALREGRAPPYAHAALLQGGTPAPSALRVPSVIVPASTASSMTHASMTGEEATAYAPESIVGAAPIVMAPPAGAPPAGAPPAGAPPRAAHPLEITAAASSVAIDSSKELPSSSGVPTLDRATVPMGPSNGAAHPNGAAYPNGAAQAAGPPSTATPLSQTAATTPVSGGVVRPPGADRTLRSHLADAQNGPVRAQGYAAPSPLSTPMPGSAYGPRTQPAGAEPLPPGATIPVVEPPRRDTPNMALLILVGVAFAALGVGLTLWIMLRSPDKATRNVAATSEPEPPAAWPPSPKRHTPKPTAQPRREPPPRPTALPFPFPQFEPPGKGKGKHGKGKGKRD
jgi:eukaryotic-like serine/threonine-protein kinase